MIPLDEALERTLEKAKALPPEDVGLLAAAGRVLREDVKAEFDVPPFDKSAMDGYAVKVADLEGAGPESPVTLKVVAEQPAGRPLKLEVERGQAVRIMTGAPLPEGAEAVVIQEDTKRKGDRVEVFKSVRPFDNCGAAGEDFKKGTTIIGQGTVLGPSEVGLIASTGRSKVKATRRPRVAVLSTGARAAARKATS